MAIEMCRPITALFHRLSADQRGITALVFAVGATVLFGFVGLATEGGTWYLAKRAAQNAADTGALAGAIASATSGTATATIKMVASAVATKNVSLNAITTVATSEVTVTSNVPPTTGFYKGISSAIEVVVNDVPQSMFAKLFGVTNVSVQGRAVALIKNPASACVISLQGDLTIGGNNSVTATSCAFVSNAIDSTAVNINGNPQPNIAVVDLQLGASCSGCSGLSPPLPTFTMPLPVTNPFLSLDSTTFPSSPCTNVGALTTLVPDTVYCSLSISNNNVVTMPSGTYFFTGNVKITGGSLTSGPGGVNIVMLGGTAAGTWTMNGGTVNLTAQKTNNAYPSLDGILIYDPSNSKSSLGGNTGDVFSGGLYFPHSEVDWGGNGASGYNCTELVADTVKMTGTAATSFATTGCPALGTPVPQTQVAALVE
jgi:Flp pilus assembly protein TadG